MTILNFFRKLFGKPQIHDVEMTVIAGRPCPVCGEYGLFHYDNYSRCEECLTEFDENMIPKEKIKNNNS